MEKTVRRNVIRAIILFLASIILIYGGVKILVTEFLFTFADKVAAAAAVSIGFFVFLTSLMIFAARHGEGGKEAKS